MLFAPSGKGRKRQKKGEKGRLRPISRKGGQTPLKPLFVTPHLRQPNTVILCACSHPGTVLTQPRCRCQLPPPGETHVLQADAWANRSFNSLGRAEILEQRTGAIPLSELLATLQVLLADRDSTVSVKELFITICSLVVECILAASSSVPGRNYTPPPPVPPFLPRRHFQGGGGGGCILKPPAAGFSRPPPPPLLHAPHP